ncbi:MAG TPA: phosphatidylserine decarboxylase [Alphaproteobacteria bacterium]|nr:phosphatidylserine decarboxylase [Alphaproteobacteria bacterium]
MRIHREGFPFIAGFAIATVVLFLIWRPLGWVGVVATVWCVWFFRDPDRVTPRRAGTLVSAADGVVCAIVSASPPPELGLSPEPRVRVSVFLNIFDVHVNRVPADGTITALNYRPGKFINASFDKASEDNERMAIAMRLADGRDVAFVQIAGLIARRIKCDLKVGQTVEAGERFGIIRFGSRTDMYLPAGYTPSVTVGQRVFGGETVVADIEGMPSAAVGGVRP